MAGRSRADAVESFFEPLQRAISCVTDAVLLGRAYYPAPEAHVLTLGHEAGVLIGRRGNCHLAVEVRYRLVEADTQRLWTASTEGYEYRLRGGRDRYLLTYHWHPIGRSPIRYPHLHVRVSAAPHDLSKAHLPTGRITPIDVIRLAITDLGVEPLRADWLTVLDHADKALNG